jgi:hypothetical protein
MDVETRMANIKSQIKRNRQNEQRRLRNKTTRSELKTRVKRAAEGLETGADDAGDQSAPHRSGWARRPRRASCTRTRPPGARPA